MSKVKVVLNREGVKNLLQSREMQDYLANEANKVRNRLGEGYAQDSYVGKNRANAMVWAETYQAKKENLESNTILKALK